MDEACIGSISEIFDAEAPYTPRGCIAQAWSVAEVLRAWVKTGKRGWGLGAMLFTLQPHVGQVVNLRADCQSAC